MQERNNQEPRLFNHVKEKEQIIPIPPYLAAVIFGNFQFT
jgi:hypothetical protein